MFPKQVFGANHDFPSSVVIATVWIASRSLSKNTAKGRVPSVQSAGKIENWKILFPVPWELRIHEISHAPTCHGKAESVNV